MMKKAGVVAAILLIIGIVGGLVTFKGNNFETTVLDEKVIETLDFNHVKLEADNANVKIISTADDKARVTLVGNKHSPSLTTNMEDDILHIQSKPEQKRLISLDLFTKATEVTVHLPEEVYDDVEIKSHNGHITIEELAADSIDLQADNGRINLDNIQGNTIFVNANNGIIEANDVSAKAFEVASDNGRIELKNINAPIVGQTHNGTISLELENLLHNTDLHADNGKIDITLKNKPENVLYDLATDNGRITVFEENKWDIQVGNGKPLLKLSSDNGRIQITEK